MSTKFKVDVSGAEVSFQEDKITVKGPKGELHEDIKHPFIHLSREGNTLLIQVDKDTSYQKAIGGTLAAAVRNMIIGVNQEYTAELELIYMHFPASLKASGNKLIVENFVGERKPRELAIPEGVKLKVSGTKIYLSGTDKYLVGQAAGTIEGKIQIKNKDRRIFKDGIFITKKP
ncbi:MAG: 50S ribosomal protein L6 [Candidatus Parvarchaeota archaeon]|jgi:large subunit ribosomal protein L6|nr:50S ribosomal protein L6 [Candidatus Parvarchaeota archaeon]